MFTGRSIRSVAMEIDMNPMTLGRYVKQAQAMGSRDLNIGYRSPQRVFSTAQENILKDYIIKAANIYFGLSPKDVRFLAYECSVEFGVKMPDQWVRDKSAGPDWFSGFLKRNPSLSIRTPEATSLSRATSFNKTNVDRFFRQLESIIERDNIKPYDIWNIDETGVTTVQKPASVVGPKGVKQIGALTSGERGTLVTMCAAVSATGNMVPPMFIFPRVKYHDHFIRDGPEGSIGVSHPSGWMTAENFFIFIKHFAKIAKPSQDQKVLLLLDNHHSHIGFDTIKFAKETGITMLSFPPHCSHKLQPLDRSVFGPFKKHISSLQDTWMRKNPAKTMSIYDLPGITRDAWPRAATQANIVNGFKVSAIHPLNSDVFVDVDFAPAYVTDRPDPSIETTEVNFSGCTNNDTDPVETVSSPRIEPLLEQHAPESQQASESPADTSFATLDAKLRVIQREVAAVPGDGHCLLHAIAFGLAEMGIEVTSETLCTMLTSEISDHIEHYMQFTNGQNITGDIDRYIRFKEYNNDTADIIISAMCTCLRITAIIYHQTEAGHINIYAVDPGRTDAPIRGDIYVVLKGTNGNAHYSGVRKINSDVQDDAEQIDYTAQPDNTSQSYNTTLPDNTPQPDTEFSPAAIRPLPKGPPRKNTGRKKRKSTVLTYTPEKNAIEEEELKLKQKKVKRGLQLKKSVKRSRIGALQKKPELKKKKHKKAMTEMVSSDEEDWFCLVCVEPYSNSRAREKWIQCQGCKDWSHEECTSVPKSNVYICHNCESDSETDLF